METLSGLGHLLLTIVAGLLMLTVLVFVHELGHYWVAKAMGMHVNAFAIMMGGVRKTDLRPYLKAPLAPGRLVASVFGLGVLVAIVGSSMALQPVYVLGLAIAGVVVPVWVMARLGRLYHLPKFKVAGTVGKSLAGGVFVLWFGTRFSGVTPEMLVGVASGSVLIALMLVYYAPTHAKERDEDEMGHGEVRVSNGEVVPVRYRPVWCRTGKDGTEFSLLVLPLGGFAAIKGMHPKPDGSEIGIENGFYSKHPIKRLAALFAGPLFSILFGLLLLFGQYATIGKKEPVNEPVLGVVPEDGPAYAAGLRVGDRIVSVNGNRVQTFYDLIANVKDEWTVDPSGQRAGKPIQVAFDRAGTVNQATIVPIVDVEPLPLRGPDLEIKEEKAIQARLGVMYALEYRGLAIDDAAKAALIQPVAMAAGVLAIFTRPTEAKENLSGPTLMAQATSAAVKEGVATLLWFSAMLSLSLGIMNLLPVVPLDGGQMVVAFLELLRGGRRLSFSLQNLLANCGLGLLVLLMLVATAADLGRTAKVNEKQAQSGSK